MNGKNKRWAEQRWDARQKERLEHIQNKKLRKMLVLNVEEEGDENETDLVQH